MIVRGKARAEGLYQSNEPRLTGMPGGRFLDSRCRGRSEYGTAGRRVHRAELFIWPRREPRTKATA